MKRFTLILALVLMVAMPTFAEHVTSETAQKVANSFLKGNGLKAKGLTNLSKAAGFANLYIFSTENGSVIVSADDRVKPILGYSLTSKFDVDNMPENLRWWLQGYSNEIQFAIDHNIEPSKLVSQQWKDLKNGIHKTAKATIIVPPLTTTEWGQGTRDNPYWYCCPKSGDAGQYTYAKAGCVAVSMAQVMKYHNHPSQGNGSHSYQSDTYGTISANFGATTYDWNNMPNTVSRNSSTQVKLAVGTLIFHCGVSVDMDYGPQASGADHANVPYALTNYFNYSNSISRIWREDFSDAQWIAILKNELDASRPLIYGGANQNYVAHSFVCDGYNSDNYFHFNWGWEGSYHGFYYSIDNLDPKYTGGAYCYNYYQDAIIGIMPSSGETPASPTNLHCTINGTNVILDWTAPDNGSYTYKIFRNGTVIAESLSTNTYTDSNLADNALYSYTVKACANSEESNSSNTSSVVIGYVSVSNITIGENDNMTIVENSILTVSGALSDENADNLILENGAQLFNNSTGVQATVKKDISGYTGDGSWYTFSTPFVNLTPSADNGLISGSYDLYAYDEDGGTEGKEWINYKSGSFNLTPSSGYLYANSTTQNLGLSGELNSGIYSQTVNLAYNNSIESLKGFNLLGNPTAHEISFTKSADVADGYYYVDNGNAWVYSPNNIVPVGRGFLVKANATGQTVTLNPQSKRDNPNPDKSQYLCLSIGQDKAYVKLNEGVSMPLIDLNGNHSCLYFLRDQKPYVMLVQDNAETLDLCFESKHNGNHTITVDTNGLSLNYLHLIDSLTGNDVDLLATPSYTFEAKMSDYATRFKLLFDNNGSSNSSTVRR